MACDADTFRPDSVTENLRAIDRCRRPATHGERRGHGRPEGPRGAAGRHSDGGQAGSKRCVEVERQRRQGRRDTGVPGGASTECGGQDEASERVRRSGADSGQQDEPGGGRRCRSENARLGAGQACPRSHPGAAAQRVVRRQGDTGVVPGSADRSSSVATHDPPQRATPDRAAGRLDDLRVGTTRGFSPALLPHGTLRRMGPGRGRGLAPEPSAVRRC